MRSAFPLQPALLLPQVPHKHTRTLAAIAHLLDELPELEACVLADLAPPGIRRDVGRKGLSAKQVVRILVLYLLLRVDFEQLEFHLADPPTYRAFCLLSLVQVPPKRACLQKNLSALRPETLQALHQIVVEQVITAGVESGHSVRIDTTPVLAPIRPMLDSSLLGDAVRVLSRLLRRAQALMPMSLPTHGRRVKRRVRSLRQERLDEEQRAALYFDLLQDTKLYVEAALFAAEFLDGVAGEKAARLATSLRAQAAMRCASVTRPSGGCWTGVRKLLSDLGLAIV